MDPNATLARIRMLVGMFWLDPTDERSERSATWAHDAAEWAVELAESVEALDQWLSKGGFLPKAWKQ